MKIVNITTGEVTEGPDAPVDLVAVKRSKHSQIEAERDAAMVQDVSFGGHTWQADQKSQALLSQAILLAQAGVYTPSTWRSSDNVDVDVNLAFLVGIAGTIAAQVSTAYATSWTRKADLEAATNEAQINAA